MLIPALVASEVRSAVQRARRLLWLWVGFAPLRRGDEEEEAREEGKCKPAAVAGTVSPSAPPKKPPPRFPVERLDKGWSEASSASPRGGGWGSDCAEEKREREKEAAAGACEFGIQLGGTSYSGEMDSGPRLTSVFTLFFSGLWHLGLTAANCEYQELGAGR